jgi:hypothetical protein
MSVDAGGFDLFQLELVGMPLLEVLPAKTCAEDLYAMVAQRLAPLVKAPVDR